MVTKSNVIVVKHKKIDLAFFIKNKDIFQNAEGRIGVGGNAVKAMLMCSNELKALMPMLLGVSATSPDWDKTVNNYWNSLSILVPERGLRLETGFIYSIDKDTEEVKKFKSTHTDSTDETLAEYVTGLNKKGERNVPLEQQYLYGTPINVRDYLWYRYCLVYGRVANNESLINLAPQKIKFYLQSETEAIELEKKQFNSEKKALLYFAELVKDDSKTANMLYALRVPGVNIAALDDYGKQKQLDAIRKSNPDLFITVYESKTLKEQAQVEEYISCGIWTRYEGSETIIDSQDVSVIIGNNVKEAITFLANPINKAKIDNYTLRLKQLRK